MFAAALLIAGLVPSAAAAAAQPVQVAKADPVRLDKARALLALSHPSELVLDANMRGWEAGIAKATAMAPGVDQLEAKYPGIVKAAIEAARPAAREFCAAFAQRSIALMAGVVADRLTAAELDEALSFFRTPAGGKMVRAMLGNIDTKTMVNDMHARAQAANGEPIVTVENVNRATQAAIRTTFAQTPAEEQVAIMRFGVSPAGKKMFAAIAEADQQILVLVNKPDPAWMAQQNETITRAMVEFVDRKKRI